MYDKENLVNDLSGLKICEGKRVTRSASRAAFVEKKSVDKNDEKVLRSRNKTKSVLVSTKKPIDGSVVEKNSENKNEKYKNLKQDLVLSDLKKNEVEKNKVFSTDALETSQQVKDNTENDKKSFIEAYSVEGSLLNDERKNESIKFERNEVSTINDLAAKFHQVRGEKTFNGKHDAYSMRKSLHVSAECEIVGRIEETNQIRDYIINSIKEKKSGNFYISGYPGTGKTAVVKNVMEKLSQNRNHDIDYFFINCMGYSTSTGVFDEICNLLKITKKTNLYKIEDYFKEKRTKPIVLVMDELDQLYGDQKNLHRVFTWATLSKLSTLIMIGISNSLDLPERKLPIELYESVFQLTFPPYSAMELQQIILSRLEKQSPEVRVSIDMAAIQLCCRKVAMRCGDARTVLELYLKADDMRRLEHQKSYCEGNSTPIRKFSQLQIATNLIPPASPTIRHVQRAIEQTENRTDPFYAASHISSLTGNSQETQQHLPLQHKLILCAALVLSRKCAKRSQSIIKIGKQKSQSRTGLSKLTFGSVYDEYVEVCRAVDMEPLDSSEMLTVCDLLDARSLARLGPNRSGDSRSRPFVLGLDLAGLEKALGDQVLLSRVLNVRLNDTAIKIPY